MNAKHLCLGLEGAFEAIQSITEALGGDTQGDTLAEAISGITVAIEEGGGGGGGGTTNYNKLSNRPQINSITLEGNSTASQLGLLNIFLVNELPDELDWVDNSLYVVDNTAKRTVEFYLIVNKTKFEIKTNYEDLLNKPTYNNVTIVGNKKAVDYGILDIVKADELPNVMTNNTLYLIHKVDSVTQEESTRFYIYIDGTRFEIIQDGMLDIEYEDIIHKPKIDNHQIEANNQTHESLGLVGVDDFVNTGTSKSSGIEIVLPEGTPDNPIEITEINDSNEMKYATNYTSSNNLINGKFDAINNILAGKINIEFVNALPDPPQPNTQYYVETDRAGVWHIYIVDKYGNVRDGGVTELDTDGFVLNTRRVGNNNLASDIPPSAIQNDIKELTATLKNKTIDSDDNNLLNIVVEDMKTSAVSTVVDSTGTDTQLPTTKAVYDAFETLVPKTRKVGTHTLEADVTANNIQDDIKELTATLKNKSIDASDNTVTNLTTGELKSGVLQTSMPESPTDEQLMSVKAIKDYIDKRLLATKPVGSLYISTGTEDPKDIFGGTWEIVSSGRYLRGVASTETAGTSVSQQLPNIKGTWRKKSSASAGNQISDIGSGSFTGDGAIRVTTSSQYNIANDGTASTYVDGFTFDASKSNSIYKDNGNVIPDSYTVHIWQRTE